MKQVLQAFGICSTINFTMRPNLFSYATSELSQDAMLCWLLAWANPETEAQSPALHQVGVDLLGLICPHSQYHKIQVKRQDGKIDILCVIDDEFAILIEDKTGTIQHSNQLARYKAHVSEKLGFPPEKIIPVYVQTGDQSDYQEIADHGYQVLSRSTLLGLLESPNGQVAQRQSDILTDFTAYLRHIEDDVQSFRRQPLSNWTDNAWRGFYCELQQRLTNGHWHYVANPSGGFIGYYWHFADIDGGRVYLQLEQHKLCFKIEVNDAARQVELRHDWHHRITTEAQRQGLTVQRPTRFGRGRWMTVAVLRHEYRSVHGEGHLDIEGTIQTLRAAQRVLDSCLESA